MILLHKCVAFCIKFEQKTVTSAEKFLIKLRLTRGEGERDRDTRRGSETARREHTQRNMAAVAVPAAKSKRQAMKTSAGLLETSHHRLERTPRSFVSAFASSGMQ